MGKDENHIRQSIEPQLLYNKRGLPTSECRWRGYKAQAFEYPTW